VASSNKTTAGGAARFAAMLPSCDERYDVRARLVSSAVPAGHYHCDLAPGSLAHHVRESLIYALGLLEEGSPERVQRARDILDRVLELQDTDTSSPTYGIWPMYAEEPLGVLRLPDWNYADFLGSLVLQVLHAWPDLTGAGQQKQLREAAGHAAWSIFRRNVRPGYTNIAVSGAAVTADAGELLGEQRLVAYAQDRLQRLLAEIDHHGGFNEYNSPGYALASIKWCERVAETVADATVRELTERVRFLLWEAYAEHFHPGTGQPAGPHSRHYENWIHGGVIADLRQRTGVAIADTARQRATVEHSEWFFAYVVPLPCPAELIGRFRALPSAEFTQQRRYIRADTDDESVVGTTWFAEDACLGSVNHSSFWTQRHALIGYWRTSDEPAVVFRVRCLKDGKDFASADLRCAQSGPRVLGLVGLLNDRGDWHQTLDRPEDGCFPMADLRVRWELTGLSAHLGGTEDLDASKQFELVAGQRRMVVHAGPGGLLGESPRWETGTVGSGRDTCAYVDAVVYHGAERILDVNASMDGALAFGVELLAAAAARPTQTVPELEIGDRSALHQYSRGTWQAGDAQLQLIIPNAPHSGGLG
jgi:hypothetical protein